MTWRIYQGGRAATVQFKKGNEAFRTSEFRIGQAFAKFLPHENHKKNDHNTSPMRQDVNFLKHINGKRGKVFINKYNISKERLMAERDSRSRHSLGLRTKRR